MGLAPSRHAAWLLAASAVLLTAGAGGEEPRVVADALASPIKLAALPMSQDLLVLQADGPAILLTEQQPPAPAPLEPPTVEGLAGLRPTAIAAISPTNFVVAWSAGRDRQPVITIHELAREGAAATAKLINQRTLPEEETGPDAGPVYGFSRGERYLHATLGGRPTRVLRARHNAGMLGKFSVLAEATGPAPIGACAQAPRGYLLTAAGGAIRFHDASAAGAPVLATYHTGLRRISKLAYGSVARPVERLLYAIEETDAGPRLYRIDAAVDERGRPTCVASPAAAGVAPADLAFLADGQAAVLAINPDDTAGRVVLPPGDL